MDKITQNGKYADNKEMVMSPNWLYVPLPYDVVDTIGASTVNVP